MILHESKMNTTTQHTWSHTQVLQWELHTSTNMFKSTQTCESAAASLKRCFLSLCTFMESWIRERSLLIQQPIEAAQSFTNEPLRLADSCLICAQCPPPDLHINHIFHRRAVRTRDHVDLNHHLRLLSSVQVCSSRCPRPHVVHDLTVFET